MHHGIGGGQVGAGVARLPAHVCIVKGPSANRQGHHSDKLRSLKAAYKYRARDRGVAAVGGLVRTQGQAAARQLRAHLLIQAPARARRLCQRARLRRAQQRLQPCGTRPLRRGRRALRPHQQRAQQPPAWRPRECWGAQPAAAAKYARQACSLPRRHSIAVECAATPPEQTRGGARGPRMSTLGVWGAPDDTVPGNAWACAHPRRGLRRCTGPHAGARRAGAPPRAHAAPAACRRSPAGCPPAAACRWGSALWARREPEAACLRLHALPCRRNRLAQAQRAGGSRCSNPSALHR